MNTEFRKKALRMLSYGVYILTSKYSDQYCASTVTWVSQTSFEPPLLCVCIKKDSLSHDIVAKRKEFILHLLGTDQKEIAGSFFKAPKITKGLLNGKKYVLNSDLPLLEDIPAYIHCKVADKLEKGDHTLFQAEIFDAVIRNEDVPLQLRDTGWTYGG